MFIQSVKSKVLFVDFDHADGQCYLFEGDTFDTLADVFLYIGECESVPLVSYLIDWFCKGDSLLKAATSLSDVENCNPWELQFGLEKLQKKYHCKIECTGYVDVVQMVGVFENFNEVNFDRGDLIQQIN